jgi:cysteinyl-tRNA synthetase
MMAALGFRPEAKAAAEEDVPAAVRELVAERQAAREAKDWAAADALREKIQAQGYVVEDRKEGPLIKPLEG